MSSAVTETMVGIEYAVPGLAKPYAQAGFRWAKPIPAYTCWGNLEPDIGDLDEYTFRALEDEWKGRFVEWGQIVLSMEHPLVVPGDENAMEAWLIFVRKFVASHCEVRYWGFEREFSTFLGDVSIDSYLRFLEATHRAIHEIRSDAIVSPAGLLLIDAAHDATDADAVDERLRTPWRERRSYEDTVRLLREGTFDAVDFHSLGDPMEIGPTVSWIRRITDRPILCGDATPCSILMGYGGKRFYPGTQRDTGALADFLLFAARGRQPAAEEWCDLVTRGICDKVRLAREYGLLAIMVGNVEDYVPPALFTRLEAWLRGGGSIHGLVRSYHTMRFSGDPLPMDRYAAYSRERKFVSVRPPLLAVGELLR